MSEWIRQIENSSIPYPQRRHLALEIESDREHLAASEGANPDPVISHSELEELEDIHSTAAFRVLNRSGKKRRTLETMIAFMPLLTAATYISKEGNMIEFIREGGAGMFAILAIGVLLMLRELQSAFRLLIVRDHSKQNLRLDTPSVLLGCLALMFLGVGSTALGIYVSATAALQAKASTEILTIGVKESLTPIVLSSLLAAVVVLAHYGTRRVLQIWNAPVID